MEKYKCICGKIFNSSQQFNGHKSHCKEHQLQKYGSLDKYNKRVQKCISSRRNGYNKYVNLSKEVKQKELDNWINKKHICKTCGKIMTKKFGSGIYCSRNCANTRELTNKTKQKISKSSKGKHLSIETKEKISKTLVKITKDEYLLNPNHCVVCNKILDYKHRNRKTCSDKCLQLRYKEIGKIIANKTTIRSKNEIAFCNKCEEYFGKENVLHNEPIFNGWDADIILPQYKLAILWNGPWHYKQITKTHKLKQVQTRDKIKINEIIKMGYIPYIIKDTNRRDYTKIDIEFDKLLNYIKNLNN